jgi:hypothetical protein
MQHILERSVVRPVVPEGAAETDDLVYAVVGLVSLKNAMDRVLQKMLEGSRREPEDLPERPRLEGSLLR